MWPATSAVPWRGEVGGGNLGWYHASATIDRNPPGCGAGGFASGVLPMSGTTAAAAYGSCGGGGGSKSSLSSAWKAAHARKAGESADSAAAYASWEDAPRSNRQTCSQEYAPARRENRRSAPHDSQREHFATSRFALSRWPRTPRWNISASRATCARTRG